MSDPRRKLPKEIIVRWADLGDREPPYLSADIDLENLLSNGNPGETFRVGVYRLISEKGAKVTIVSKP